MSEQNRFAQPADGVHFENRQARPEEADSPEARAGALVLLLEAKAGGDERADAAIESLVARAANPPD
jgi:hypothetical protein